MYITLHTHTYEEIHILYTKEFYNLLVILIMYQRKIKGMGKINEKHVKEFLVAEECLGCII